MHLQFVIWIPKWFGLVQSNIARSKQNAVSHNRGLDKVKVKYTSADCGSRWLTKAPPRLHAESDFHFDLNLFCFALTLCYQLVQTIYKIVQAQRGGIDRLRITAKGNSCG